MAAWAPEYTADNSRLLAEMGDYQFWDTRSSIAELYAWYAANSAHVNSAVLNFDCA